MAHQILSQSKRPEGPERRSHRRYPFPIIQRIAPAEGAAVPAASEFFEVRYHEIGRGGFSFFMPTRPDFGSLVAALGLGEDRLHVAAEVDHCRKVRLEPSGHVEAIEEGAADEGDSRASGVPLFLVGCRFTGRITEAGD
jgi:hypothetical protein